MIIQIWCFSAESSHAHEYQVFYNKDKVFASSMLWLANLCNIALTFCNLRTLFCRVLVKQKMFLVPKNSAAVTNGGTYISHHIMFTDGGELVISLCCVLCVHKLRRDWSLLKIIPRNILVQFPGAENEYENAHSPQKLGWTHAAQPILGQFAAKDQEWTNGIPVLQKRRIPNKMHKTDYYRPEG